MNSSYKQANSGVIPRDWEEHAIGELLDFEGGSQPDKSLFSSMSKPGFVRLIQIRDYKSDKFATYVPRVLARRFCTKDDIMIGRYGPPIFQILRGLEGAYNVALIKAKPRREITASYAYHFLRNDRLFTFVEKLSQRSSGQTGIDLAELKRYPLPLPPTTAEQEAVTEALNDSDAAIASLKQLIAKKRHIKQGAVQQLLAGVRRLPGFEEKWRGATLGELAEIIRGRGLSKGQVSSSGVRPCILYGELFTKYGPVITTILSRTDSSEGLLSVHGDVLMPGSTTTIGSDLATASAVLSANVALGGDINVIRCAADAVDPTFLAYYLRHTKRDAIGEIAQGTTIHHLYGRHLKQLAVQLPPLSEQAAIGDILTDMDKEIALFEAKLTKARQLKRGMMQELLTGRIRLA
jgi:type I restriction enzyme S subunit